MPTADLRDLVCYQLQRERDLVAGMQGVIENMQKQHADEKFRLLNMIDEVAQKVTTVPPGAATVATPEGDRGPPPAPKPRRAKKHP